MAQLLLIIEGNRHSSKLLEVKQMDKKKSRSFRFVLLGTALGVVITLLLVVVGMRALMIVERESPLGFDDTVARLEQSIRDQGWTVVASKSLNKSMAKHGVVFEPKVRLIQLCKASYAAEVLQDARHVACLMPCTFAVYEDDDKKVKISKMNLGLMGKVFGGTINRIMGGAVAEEEEKILSPVLGRK